MSITTRPITANDLPDVADMIAALARFHDDTPLGTLGDLKRDLLGTHPWYAVIVAEAAHGALLGYAALLPLGQLQFARRGMDMHHLFVRDAARGQGVGSALVRACRAHASEMQCGVLTVGTDPDNHTAAAFYAARGFKPRTGSGLRFSMQLEPPGQPPT